MPINYSSNELKIKNNFPPDTIPKIVEKIYQAIGKEPNLSWRTQKEITRRIRKNQLYIAFIGEEMVGFIFLRPLGRDLGEINGLYVWPDYRQIGLANKILTFVSQQKYPRYFGATFLPAVAALVESIGFERCDLNYLSFGEKIFFFRERLKPHRLWEVIRHRKKNHLILLKKDGH